MQLFATLKKKAFATGRIYKSMFIFLVAVITKIKVSCRKVVVQRLINSLREYLWWALNCASNVNHVRKYDKFRSYF